MSNSEISNGPEVEFAFTSREFAADCLVNKLYKVIGRSNGFITIVDEAGVDKQYSEKYFVLLYPQEVYYFHYDYSD